MIEITDLSKSFSSEANGRTYVLKNISLTVSAGQLFTLLGPSGCGKSTLLRCIAGLDTPDSGEIRVGGELFYSSALGVNKPAHRRKLGMVFQSYAIWPHMSVFQNVAFPLEVTGQGNVDKAVNEALALVGLAELGKRSATQLSGGQQQRVALARALVSRPDVLLLDEPFSNLDANLREQLRSELVRIKAATGTTAIFVTHDQTEALSLSDQIAVVDRGVVLEVGMPEVLYETPGMEFTARFLGNANIIPVSTGGEGHVESPIGRIFTRGELLISGSPTVAVGVRPERIVVHSAAQAGTDRNVFAGRVVSRSYLGQYVEMMLNINDVPIRSLLPLEQATVSVGDQLLVSFLPEHVIPLAA